MKDSIDFGSRFRILKGGKISLVVSALLAGTTMTFAAPTGGVVNTGSATISQSGSTTNINQATQRASINWQSFSVGASETVNFVQPNSSSVTLNRVVGNETSIINGALNANGKVWILNSNGVTFGNGASINTSGLVASTMNISDTNFMNGNHVFESTGSNASIINMGSIKVSDGGYVALLGKNVSNSGVIEATKGTVVLGAGDKITLNFNGDSLVGIAIDQGTLDALVENKGAIIADGGKIFLTTKAANDLLNGVVNNTGLLQAQTLDDVTGYVEVYAHGGTANVGGSLDASAPVSGNGGFIETSGAVVNLSSDISINAGSAKGKGGKWLLDPYDYVIDAAAASTIDGVLDTGTDVTISTANAASVGINGTVSALGDITVSSAITKTAGGDATLTLQAANTIVLDAPISSTNGKLNVDLLADNDSGTHNGAGIVILNNSISTNGGNINFGDGATMSIGGVSTKVGGDVYVGGSSAQYLNTNGGNVAINGEMILANPSGLNINSAGGNVLFGGLLNAGNDYASVAHVISWTNTLAEAKSGTGADVGDTYLATITSRLENAVAGRVANYTGAWLGAQRDLTNPDPTAAYTWRWKAGPEGLMDSGAGLAFFQQGVGAINGQYNNFGAGEPNGTGSGGESAAQFYGNLSQWNDLPANNIPGSNPIYGIFQYIKETNLAASPLSVNAGSGTVTFSGNVGANKALGSLSVTAGTINTNGIKADGAISLETGTGNINVGGNIVSNSTGSNAITLNAGKSASAGTATGGDIIVSNGATFTTGSGGRATLYTGSITNSPNLAGLGNSRYGSDEVATNFTTPLGSGVYAVYRERPTITVTRQPDGTLTTSGYVNGDTSSILTPRYTNGMGYDVVGDVPVFAPETTAIDNIVTANIIPTIPKPPVIDTNVGVTTGMVVKKDMAPVISKGFAEGALIDLVSKPLAGELTQSLSLSEVKTMQQSKDSDGKSSGQEVRVAVSHDGSIIDLVNGGVKLPKGVEQEFYVINVEK
jgi:filamentous hemagglutinin family protein